MQATVQHLLLQQMPWQQVPLQQVPAQQLPPQHTRSSAAQLRQLGPQAVLLWISHPRVLPPALGPPAQHTCPAEHILPHIPQLRTLFVTQAKSPPSGPGQQSEPRIVVGQPAPQAVQLVVERGTQLRSQQSPVPHMVPQLPQLVSSWVTSAHPCEQQRLTPVQAVPP
jgi:hypothetical protein